MKTAILVAMAEDGRSGQVLSGVMPYDAAVKAFKAAVEAGVSPDPQHPVLEVWVGDVKRRRFKAAAAPAAPAPAPAPVAKPAAAPPPIVDLPADEPVSAPLDPESSTLDPSAEDTEPILPITNASPGSLAPGGKRRK
jgi:hypothetical protein